MYYDSVIGPTMDQLTTIHPIEDSRIVELCSQLYQDLDKGQLYSVTCCSPVCSLYQAVMKRWSSVFDTLIVLRAFRVRDVLSVFDVLSVLKRVWTGSYNCYQRYTHSHSQNHSIFV